MKDLKLMKKIKNLINLVYAPLSGETVALEDIEDPIIATKALGDGIAIKPNDNNVFSPCSGVIKLIHSQKNVIIIHTETGADILINIGINLKDIPKNLFKSFVQVGSIVETGDLLLQFDKNELLKDSAKFNTIVVVNNLETSCNEIRFINNSKNILACKSLLYVIGKKEAINSNEFNEYLKRLSTNMKKENNNLKLELIVINKTGIHARPASVLSSLAKKFTSEIKLYKEDDKADAKSLIEILGLGISYNDNVTLEIIGEDAEEALSAISEAFASGFGEEGHSDKKTVTTTAQQSTNTTDSNQEDTKIIEKIKTNEKSVVISGVVNYPSLVMGKAFFIVEEDISITENSEISYEEEKHRLLSAIDNVKSKIQEYINNAQENNKTSQAEIFTAHAEVLKDDFLINSAKELLKESKTAEYAFKQATNKTCDILSKTQNSLLKERISDIKDIQKSVINVLSGKELKPLEIPENSIVIAEDLNPSNITNFNSNVKGVILSKGSSTSHISIMMKNEGIASLVSVGSSVLHIKEGTAIILDSKQGNLIVNPSEEEKNSNTSKVEELQKIRNYNLIKTKNPAITTDGIRIKVLGNVGGIDQAVEAYNKGGEGIGLVRSEFLFMSCKSAPTEEWQRNVYQDICNAMHGEEVVVRTLDVGGDKPISYINIPSEENPIMGLRGVRNYHLNKEIFYSQIRALLSVNPAGICKIMIPMISGIGEVKKIKEVIAKEKESLGIKAEIKVGIMVEVPSVALLAKQFAKHVDFFSIGTNDLAQYILAMDRGHNVLTKHLNNLNPAILKSIDFTCKGAKEYNVPVGVCGAMASEIESVPILIGLGVSSLSCTSALIPDVKAFIRSVSYSKCVEVAQKSLELETQDEVKSLIYKEFSGLL